ncbi:MAG: hypothetical protein HY040_28665 [Planctomycetes bacterium]|nr:hypothetical protein [Planctomycetota bacterium]
MGSRGDFQRERLRAKVFREVFGNPFRSPSLKLNCLNSGTIQLAEHIYHERAFGDLPVLAEAMEKEGCTATDILEHFRENSFHVRGCWALDLILDKS